MIHFTWLGSLCLAMFTGSFLAGIIPLIVPLSPKSMHIMSAFGGGLLVGTALLVVIPEGIQTFYEYSQAYKQLVQQRVEPASHEDGVETDIGVVVGVCLLLGFSLMFFVDQMSSYLHLHRRFNGNGAQLSMRDEDNPSSITLQTFESQSTISTRFSNNTSSPSNRRNSSFSSSVHHEHNHSHFSTVLGMIIHCAADGIAMVHILLSVSSFNLL
jgi:hypothetical protein